MLRFARAPSRATSSVRGGVRGCTAIKRGFAPINRRCESPPRARVAGCTCNFNAHVEQPFEAFVVAFAFGFFRGSQIKNVNKQGGVRGVRNRPKAAHGSFCSTHSFFGCFDLLSFCFLFCLVISFSLFVSGHFQCGTLQLRMLQVWRQRMHFIALKISVISADFTLVIQSALGSAQSRN